MFQIEFAVWARFIIFVAFAQVASACLLTALIGRWWVGPAVWAVLFTLDVLYEWSDSALAHAVIASPPMWIAIVWMFSNSKDRMGRVHATTRKTALFLGIGTTLAASATYYFFLP